MQSLASIRELLASRGLAPNKSLGQNFLIEPAHVTRLVEASGADANDLVLEVGPGTGVLTDAILDIGCRVIACELDHGLADLLRERYAGQDRFTLIEGDCLASKQALNPDILIALAGRPFRLVANLPYGAASPLMIALATRFHPSLVIGTRSTSGTRSASDGVPRGSTAEAGPACLGQFVTIQREVADRLRAATGTKDYGEMGVLVQAMCEVQRITVLPPGCFWPTPKVESEMVAITPRPSPLTNDPAGLASLCRILFTHRRKQIGGVLAKSAPHLLSRLPDGVNPTMRAEQLSIQQLVKMSKHLEPRPSGSGSDS